MAKRSDLTLIVTATTSFLGGLALGMLLAPKSGRESREWISNQTHEAADWLDNKSREAFNRGEEHIEKVAQTIKETVRESVPNLYKATEDIGMEEDDFQNQQG